MKRNALALFGAVAVVLTLTIVVTLSGATVSIPSIGKLRCYDVQGAEKAC